MTAAVVVVATGAAEAAEGGTGSVGTTTATVAASSAGVVDEGVAETSVSGVRDSRSCVVGITALCLDFHDQALLHEGIYIVHVEFGVLSHCRMDLLLP